MRPRADEPPPARVSLDREDAVMAVTLLEIWYNADHTGAMASRYRGQFERVRAAFRAALYDGDDRPGDRRS